MSLNVVLSKCRIDTFVHTIGHNGHKKFLSRQFISFMSLRDILFASCRNERNVCIRFHVKETRYLLKLIPNLFGRSRCIVENSNTTKSTGKLYLEHLVNLNKLCYLLLCDLFRNQELIITQTERKINNFFL